MIDVKYYRRIHYWVRKNKTKPKFCEKCKKKTSELVLANKSQMYRKDVKDFDWLCKCCALYNHPKKRVRLAVCVCGYKWNTHSVKSFASCPSCRAYAKITREKIIQKIYFRYQCENDKTKTSSNRTSSK